MRSTVGGNHQGAVNVTPENFMNALVTYRNVFAHWVAVVLVGAFSILPMVPRSGSSDDQIDRDRVFDHIQSLAGDARPIGSPANRRSREYIVTELTALGLKPQQQEAPASDYYGGTDLGLTVVNVMARIDGSESTGSVLLMSHYDTVPWSPGANDDAAGVAVVLEVTRVLLSAEPLRNDVIVLLTDGEEPAPRFGSTAFVNRHPWASDVGFVVNLEAIGDAGRSLLIDVGEPTGWAVDQYAAAVPAPSAFSFLTALTKAIGGSNTDFAPFRDAGAAGVDFAYLGGSSVYHTERDSVDRINTPGVLQHGRNTLALARHIGTLDLDEPRAGSEKVYFSVGPSSLVRYPNSWGLPIVVLAGAVLALQLSRTGSWKPVLSGAFRTLAIAGAVAIVAVPVWLAIANWRTTMASPEAYGYLIVLALLIGASTLALRSRLVGSFNRPDSRAEVIVMFWVLGVAATLFGAEVGYLFALPAVVATLSGSTQSLESRNFWIRTIRSLAAVATSMIVLVPAIDIFFQLAQPRRGNVGSELLWMIAIPAFLLALLAAELSAFRPRVEATSPQQ